MILLRAAGEMLLGLAFVLSLAGLTVVAGLALGG